MAYCLFDSKPLPEPTQTLCQLNPQEQTVVKLPFQNELHQKMSAKCSMILFRPQCLKDFYLAFVLCVSVLFSIEFYGYSLYCGLDLLWSDLPYEPGQYHGCRCPGSFLLLHQEPWYWLSHDKWLIKFHEQQFQLPAQFQWRKRSENANIFFWFP